MMRERKSSDKIRREKLKTGKLSEKRKRETLRQAKFMRVRLPLGFKGSFRIWSYKHEQRRPDMTLGSPLRSRD